ncbi:hypothetical protein BVH03_22330 [Pseudomonas sp. PA15(2017)]|uniref:hypothetical protein n=1 Tax=Pseudomonas sp. PA15(2017) TaxID=1932111 RepID=UPI00095A56D7|nr:hypothetical protein [Pseudomonas sp. PA15(2017)]OLU22984.1 hypothetical protein BVH03_22330 [Pseudomonas sp. PA15(2017)]
MKYLARVNPKYFAAAELFAAKKDVRYYLNGVLIEPHSESGVVIVGTCGARIVVIHDPDGWCDQPIIVGDIPRSLISACKSKGDPKKLSEPKKLWIANNGAVVTGSDEVEPPKDPFTWPALHACRTTIIDAKFPDWRRVLPKERKEAPVRFPPINPALLVTVNDAASIIDPRALKSRSAIRFEVQGESEMIVARISCPELIERFVAVIMPLRDDLYPNSIVPAFLEAPAPAPKPKIKPRMRQTPDGWVKVEASA